MDTARRITDPERDQVDRSARLQADGARRRASQEGSEENLVNTEDRQYLAVPYAEREAAKAAGAKWDWREKLWYIGPEGTREGLAKWLPENSPAPAPSDPREEFAAVLRELGGDLSGDHPNHGQPSSPDGNPGR